MKPILLTLLVLTAAACSSDNTLTGNIVISPGGTFPVGTQVDVSGSGTYNLSDATTGLTWSCSGTVTLSIASEAGQVEHSCGDGTQSVDVQGPGTVQVQLGAGGELTVLASSDQ